MNDDGRVYFIGAEPPSVTIVTGNNGDAIRVRYLEIFADVKLFKGDFG